MIIQFILWTLGGISLLLFATYVVDYIIKAPSYSGPRSNHFNGKTFHNLDGTKARGFIDILKWSLSGEPGEWQEITENETKYGKPPVSTPQHAPINITFVNHATFLIQAGGLNILTDPIWSLRASPFQWIGPKRMRPPGIRFEDLPKIDVVLISHNHYDHLDIHSVKKLYEKFDPLFITPLGVSIYLQNHGITNTTELDWWNERKISGGVSISAVPAQHFSGRGLSDRDKTLWCGYVIETIEGNIYFAGDTGFDGFFKEIGRRFTPIEVALIPIGAYRPRWFMEPIHVDPEQAVLIHKDIEARTSIGMHFGTFPLADDGMAEPVQDLAKAKTKYDLSNNEFITLEEGNTFKTANSTSQMKKTASG